MVTCSLEYLGGSSTRRIFALLPQKMADGKIIWLRHFWEKKETDAQDNIVSVTKTLHRPEDDDYVPVSKDVMAIPLDDPVWDDVRGRAVAAPLTSENKSVH